jgi:hypothetical protein
MKEYGFRDPDDDNYEITVPSYVVRDIIISYLQKTYYWSVAVTCFIIGTLFGILISK